MFFFFLFRIFRIDIFLLKFVRNLIFLDLYAMYTFYLMLCNNHKNTRLLGHIYIYYILEKYLVIIYKVES